MQPLIRTPRLDQVLEQVQATALNSLDYSTLNETINGFATQLDSSNSQWVLFPYTLLLLHD